MNKHLILSLSIVLSLGMELTVFAGTCSKDIHYRAYRTSVNLCLKLGGSKDFSSYESCMSDVAYHLSRAPRHCRKLSQRRMVRDTAAFMRQALKKDLEKNSEAISEVTLNYLDHWLEQMSSDHRLVKGIESEVNKTLAYSWAKTNAKILKANSPVKNLEEYMLVSAATFLKEASKKSYSSGKPQKYLLPTFAFTEVLSSLLPKVKLAAKIRSLACQIKGCDNDDLKNFLKTLMAITDINKSFVEDPYFMGGSEFSQAAQFIVQNKVFLQQAVQNTKTYLNLEGRGDKKYLETRMSNLYSLIQEVMMIADSLKTDSLASENIDIGLDRDGGLNAIVHKLKVESSDLSKLSLLLEQDRKALIGLLKEDLNQGRIAIENYKEEQLIVKQMKQLAKDVNLLRNSFSKEKDVYAKKQAKFNKIEVKDGENLWVPDLLESFSINAQDARYYDTGNKANANDLNLEELAVRSWDVAGGEAFSLTVEGQWSPVCAIKRDHPDLNTKSIKTGPSGYVVNQSFGKNSVSSRERFFGVSNYSDIGKVHQTCTNFGSNLGKSFGGLPGGLTGGSNIAVSDSNCSSRSSGGRMDYGTRKAFSNADVASNNANFSGGFISDATPFVDLPAGALIAVVQSQYRYDKKYYVMNRNNRIEIKEDSKVYLIVNDCLNSARTEEAKLDLKAYRLSTLDEAIRVDLRTAIRLVDIAFSPDNVNFDLVMGSDFNSEVNLIKTEVLADILSVTSTFDDYPVARQYLNNLLDYKTVQLIRKAKVIVKDQEYKDYLIRLAAIHTQKKIGLRSEDVLQMQAKEILDGIAISTVGPKMIEVTDFMIRNMLPVIKFHLGNETLSNGVSIDLESLLDNAHIGSELDQLSESYSNLLNSMAKLLEQNHMFLTHKPQQSILAIVAPNPSLSIEDTLNQSVPYLPKDSSKILWEAVFGKEHQFTDQVFSLKPNDLYSDRLRMSLRCNHQKPVIEDVLLVLVSSDETMNSHDLDRVSTTTTIRVGPSFSSISDKGFAQYKVSENEAGISDMKTLMIQKNQFNENYLESLFKTYGKKTSAGLSPFADWHLSTRSIKNTIRDYASLFYQQPNNGLLLNRESEVSDFEDDFSDVFEPSNDIEYFAEKITDIALIVKYSSMTRNNPAELGKWLESCESY